MLEGVDDNRALAARLVVSRNTVKHHIRELLIRTGNHNRLELVLWALRSGVVTL